MKHYTMLPRGVSLLAVLMLCALSVSSQTRLQFWFDSDKTIRQADLPASGILKGKIDMNYLSNGFHIMYMRVKQTGAQYEYSPITMSSFIKFATGEGAKLQYWFDDDADNFSTIDVDAESGDITAPSIVLLRCDCQLALTTLCCNTGLTTTLTICRR